MKKRTVAFAALVAVVAGAISFCKNERGKTLSVVSWNVQTFFDAHDDGTEFREFSTKSKDWGEQRYIERLAKLSAKIAQFNADVLVLQEIENEAVLHDLLNRLPVTCAYKYAAFAKSGGGAFGCAVLSRWPLGGMCVHQAQLAENGTVLATELRPLIEVRVEHPRQTLVLFALHWKSQSGGNKHSPLFRRVQEQVLADRVLQTNAGSAQTPKPPLVLAAGDFNRSAEQFTAAEDPRKVVFAGRAGAATALSPWLAFPQENPPGSYFFCGEWSRIDNIFVFDSGGTHGAFGETSAAGARLASFAVIADSDLLNGEGEPFRYEVYSGRGFSDHLPVKAEFAF